MYLTIVGVIYVDKFVGVNYSLFNLMSKLFD